MLFARISQTKQQLLTVKRIVSAVSLDFRRGIGIVWS
jgi:hypothetical protein